MRNRFHVLKEEEQIYGGKDNDDVNADYADFFVSLPVFRIGKSESCRHGGYDYVPH
jgi:hypothetical protein